MPYDREQQLERAIQNLMPDGRTTRRGLLAAAGSFALAASGLFLPASIDAALAREGAKDGALGGRHGQNRHGRDKRRDRGDRKGDNKERNDKSNGPGSSGIFIKDVAFRLHNARTTSSSFSAEYYYFGSWYFENGRGNVPKWKGAFFPSTSSIDIQFSDIDADRVRITIDGQFIEGENYTAGTPTIKFNDQNKVPLGENEVTIPAPGFEIKRLPDRDGDKWFQVTLT